MTAGAVVLVLVGLYFLWKTDPDIDHTKPPRSNP